MPPLDSSSLLSLYKFKLGRRDIFVSHSLDFVVFFASFNFSPLVNHEAHVTLYHKNLSIAEYNNLVLGENACLVGFQRASDQASGIADLTFHNLSTTLGLDLCAITCYFRHNREALSIGLEATDLKGFGFLKLWRRLWPCELNWHKSDGLRLHCRNAIDLLDGFEKLCFWLESFGLPISILVCVYRHHYLEVKATSANSTLNIAQASHSTNFVHNSLESLLYFRCRLLVFFVRILASPFARNGVEFYAFRDGWHLR
mmetsp:Transcript_117467/g.184738  ORF Transcript_117467/g.184738 Transcript_117467/m.184738 type:complete len:256 (+) Transcript_117467:87-854(+)